MSKKDYIKFAEMFSALRQDQDILSKNDLLEKLYLSVCQIFIKDNPNFDTKKFFQACYVD